MLRKSLYKTFKKSFIKKCFAENASADCGLISLGYAAMMIGATPSLVGLPAGIQKPDFQIVTVVYLRKQLNMQVITARIPAGMFDQRNKRYILETQILHYKVLR